MNLEGLIDEKDIISLSEMPIEVFAEFTISFRMTNKKLYGILAPRPTLPVKLRFLRREALLLRFFIHKSTHFQHFSRNLAEALDNEDLWKVKISNFGWGLQSFLCNVRACRLRWIEVCRYNISFYAFVLDNLHVSELKNETMKLIVTNPTK